MDKLTKYIVAAATLRRTLAVQRRRHPGGRHTLSLGLLRVTTQSAHVWTSHIVYTLSSTADSSQKSNSRENLPGLSDATLYSKFLEQLPF